MTILLYIEEPLNAAIHKAGKMTGFLPVLSLFLLLNNGANILLFYLVEGKTRGPQTSSKTLG